MKIFAIKHKPTNSYIRIGINQRYVWNQFPTNVIRHNIPPERRNEYIVEEFLLGDCVPLRKFTTDKSLISHQAWNLKK